MKKIVLILLVLSQHVCGQTLTVREIPAGMTSSFRALSVIDDSVAWVAGTNGTVGRTTDGGKSWLFTRVRGFENSDFRSLYAFDRKKAVIANAGSPAIILLTTNGGKSWKVVYANNDPLAFFDGIDFHDDNEGIIYGDPVDGRLMILRTTNGGRKWQPAADNSRPAMAEGEASFAASGTAIRCFGAKKIFIATGGTISRLLISDDGGKRWEAEVLPAIHGRSSTGVFSVAFANDTTGIIVGGDYLNEKLMVDHVFFSYDGGHGWVPSNTLTGGYRECVEFIGPLTAVAVGPGGFDITFDAGREWSTLSEERGFHVVRKARKGNLIIAAGINKIAILTQP